MAYENLIDSKGRELSRAGKVGVFGDVVGSDSLMGVERQGNGSAIMHGGLGRDIRQKGVVSVHVSHASCFEREGGGDGSRGRGEGKKCKKVSSGGSGGNNE